jgi:nucleoside recognition membrane protein YjiH
MENIILAIFIITAFVALIWVIATDKTTQEEQKEMLDSDEMFP